MAEEKKSYRILSPLRHDGEKYRPDDPRRSSVDLTVEEAEALKPLGVIGDPVTPEQEAELRAAALAAFVPTLTVADVSRKGALTASARQRATETLGFEPADDEMKAALDTYAKARSAEDTE